MTKVFIDGSAGTTGLKIQERLSDRKDLSLITLPDEWRKNIHARQDAIHHADIVFLCLPDAAAVEAATLAEGSETVIIDTSTAHRTDSQWIYGFPELSGKRAQIVAGRRIANPGCHASGFLALIEPLIKNHLIDPETALTCFSITGYSGGGKKMIAEYENKNRNQLLEAPRQYGLTQFHKHLPEMKIISGLATTPVFCPIVSDFYSGMEVVVALFAKDVKGSVSNIREIYRSYFDNDIIWFDEKATDDGFLPANELSGYDDMQITVQGNEERILLVSRFDNLGKGASGAAIQNMNLVLGLDEKTGLKLSRRKSL